MTSSGSSSPTALAVIPRGDSSAHELVVSIIGSMNVAATPAAVALLERVADGITERVGNARRSVADPTRVGAAALPVLALAAVRAPLTLNITERHKGKGRTSFLARELLGVLRYAAFPQLFGGRPFDAVANAVCEQACVIYLLGELIAAGRMNAVLEGTKLRHISNIGLTMLMESTALFHSAHAFLNVNWRYFDPDGAHRSHQMISIAVLEGLIRGFCNKFGATPPAATLASDGTSDIVAQFRAVTQSPDGLVLGPLLPDAAARLYMYVQHVTGQTAPTGVPITLDVFHFSTPAIAPDDPEIVALL